MVYAPSVVTAKVAGGIDVRITETTQYPFNSTITFKIEFNKPNQKARFPISFRIPLWTRNAYMTINQKRILNDTHEGTVARIDREWNHGDIITLELPMEVRADRWHQGAVAIERGPLIYALNMKEKWTRRQFTKDESLTYNDWYYEVTSDTPWNVALHRDRFDDPEFYDVEVRTVKGYPWNNDNAPVRLRTTAEFVDNWTIYNQSAGPIRFRHMGWPADKEQIHIELIPYGSTTLRITEFPIR